MNLPEPTAEQCEQMAKVFDDKSSHGFAMWYPQMGGYLGKSVAVFDKSWTEFENATTGGCVDVYVWHDGEFPFHDGENPCIIHHCDPQQFIDFGTVLKEINYRGRKDESQPDEQFIPIADARDKFGVITPVSFVFKVGDNFRKGNQLFKTVYVNDEKSRISLELVGVFVPNKK